jgi:glycosyltransferase involved in cell wall biosynthesis
MYTWHLITGAYPPQPGGVSDYTRGLARALAKAGDIIHVWAPALEPAHDDLPEERIVVHRLDHAFTLRGLLELSARLGTFAQPRRLLVQYVPHAFGYRALNLPFCAWLAARRRDQVWIMFHEAVFPFGQRPRRTNILALGTHVMAALLVNRADRVLVSTPAWESRLRRLHRGPLSCRWLPIPSNLPAEVEPEPVAALRRHLLGRSGRLLIGHFGTYGSLITPLLVPLVPRLLAGGPERRMLLLGRGGEASFEAMQAHHPELAQRIVATGALDPEPLARHLAACDILVQPFADGVSTRRTSLMAGLALGMPVVSNHGALTEPEWSQWRATALAADASPRAMAEAVERLLAAPHERAELVARARGVYAEHLSMQRTVRELRREAAGAGA